jgi:hypothetical protein
MTIRDLKLLLLLLRHHAEVARLRAELEAARVKAATDLVAAREAAAKDVAAAEARAQR